MKKKPSFPQSSLYSKIQSIINSNDHWKENLNKILVEYRELLQIDRIKVYKFAQDNSGEVIAESVDEAFLPSLLGLHFPATDIPDQAREIYKKHLKGTIIDVSAKKKIIYTFSSQQKNNSENYLNFSYHPVDGCHIQYLLNMGVMSSLVTPILFWDKLWGLIVVHHSEPRRFSTEELEKMQFLSKEISLVLTKQQLTEEAEYYRNQETLLSEIDTFFQKNAYLQEQWQTILDKIVANFKADGGKLYLNFPNEQDSKDKGIKYINNGILIDYEENDEAVFFKKLNEQIKVTILDKVPFGDSKYLPLSFVLSDLKQDEKLTAFAQICSDNKIATFLFIPLQSQHEWLGYLMLFRKIKEVEKKWAGNIDDTRNMRPRQSFDTWTQFYYHGEEWDQFDVKKAQILGRQLSILSIQQRLFSIIDSKSSYDKLTQLPNANFFTHQLTLSLVNSVDQGKILAVIIFNIDQFKRINESLGHLNGDRLLQEVSHKIQDFAENYALDKFFLARWHGDGFALIIDNVTYPDDIARICQDLLNTFEEPFNFYSQLIHLSLGIGVSFAPYDGTNAATLLKNAENAMFQAKKKGRNNYQFYNLELSKKKIDKLSLENDLHQAIAREELLLYYQPQVELKTGNVIGLEALIRWQHPSLGLVSPTRFIPIAEEIGLIKPIGEWVIEASCKQISYWEKLGLKPIKISVNVSGIQFQDQNLVEKIKQILSKTKVNPIYLEIEITESVLIENVADTITKLKQLQAEGISIALDDFGTGYSSLATLKNFPIDKLKIDRSLVRNLHKSIEEQKLCQGILAIAEALNLKTTVEGVETIEQLNIVLNIGFHEIQGYFITPPLPVESLDRFLLNRQVLNIVDNNCASIDNDYPIKAVDLKLDNNQMTIVKSFDSQIQNLEAELNHKIKEYTELKTEIKQQKTRERIVMETAQKIRQSLKIDNILNTTVTEVRHLLDTDRVFLFRFDQNWLGEVVVESFSQPQYSILGEWIDEPCFREKYVKFYRQGRVRAIEDITKAGLAPCHLELLLKYQVKSNLVLPIVYEDKLWGLMIAHACQKIRQWHEDEVTLLSQIAIQAAIAIHQGELYAQLQEANVRLEKLSSLDGLTQIANRYYFDQYLFQEWKRLLRRRDTLSLILLDVDHFKWFNDTYGHQAGDQCLQKVAKALESVVHRPTDLVARYGGEEFVVVLPNTNSEDALIIANKIREVIKENQIPHVKSPHQIVTVSLGIASFIPQVHLSVKMLIQEADKALYQAKESGRDQAFLSQYHF